MTPADKCEAAKLKVAGKYGFWRLKEEAKGLKTRNSAGLQPVRFEIRG